MREDMPKGERFNYVLINHVIVVLTGLMVVRNF